MSTPRVPLRTGPDAQPVTTIEASDYTISINGTSVNPSNISWVSDVTMAAPSTSNIYFGQLPSFYNSNISSINPCSSILIGDFVVLNKNHEYDSWDNTGSDFYNKGPPTECLSVGGDAVIENKLGIGTSSPVEKLHVYRNTSGESNVHIQAYSDTTGNKAALYLGTPHAGDPNSQPKCAIIADTVGWSRANLHFCLETSQNNGSAYRASTSNSRMMIDGITGYVGIGTSSPAHPLHVIGDIYATGNVTAYSDVRNKKNLKTIEDPVSKIEKINGYTYEKDGIAYTGLVAQELLEVLPEAVSGSEELGYGIAYGNMAGIFVEAIKELNSKIKTLENKLSQIV